jgi:hypothetical protein
MDSRLILIAALITAIPAEALAVDRKDAELAMTEASTAIDSAEHADAAQYAPPDLLAAHDMLNNAQAAYDHRHWTESMFAAESAKVDADLAVARSRQHRAEEATGEVERSVRGLREQLGIRNGEQP